MPAPRKSYHRITLTSFTKFMFHKLEINLQELDY